LLGREATRRVAVERHDDLKNQPSYLRPAAMMKKTSTEVCQLFNGTKNAILAGLRPLFLSMAGA
jgi:hypothetical protein